MGDPAILGYGLLVPFRRGANDFQSAGGEELVKASIRTILGTRCGSATTQGEIPFNQALGSLLPLLRHENMDDPAIDELARYYVVDAIRRNEPRVRLREVRFVKAPADYSYTIIIRYDVIDRNVSGNRVLVRDVTQEVTT